MSRLRTFLISLLLLAAGSGAVLAQTVRVRLAVKGMCCAAACGKHVHDVLVKIPGVTDVYVDSYADIATLTLDTKMGTPDSVAHGLAVATKGRYSATVLKE